MLNYQRVVSHFPISICFYALNREIRHTFPLNCWKGKLDRTDLFSQSGSLLLVGCSTQEVAWIYNDFEMTLRFLVTRAADYERSIDSRETIYWKQQKTLILFHQFPVKDRSCLFQRSLGISGNCHPW